QSLRWTCAVTFAVRSRRNATVIGTARQPWAPVRQRRTVRAPPVAVSPPRTGAAGVGAVAGVVVVTVVGGAAGPGGGGAGGRGGARRGGHGDRSGVARVADAVVVRVHLRRVGDRRAVVDEVLHTVAVGVRERVVLRLKRARRGHGRGGVEPAAGHRQAVQRR